MIHHFQNRDLKLFVAAGVFVVVVVGGDLGAVTVKRLSNTSQPIVDRSGTSTDHFSTE